MYKRYTCISRDHPDGSIRRAVWKLSVWTDLLGVCVTVLNNFCRSEFTSYRPDELPGVYEDDGTQAHDVATRSSRWQNIFASSKNYFTGKPYNFELLQFLDKSVFLPD